MGRSFARIAFTPLVKKHQTMHGSRSQYKRVEQSSRAGDAFTEAERAFYHLARFFLHGDG